MRSVFGWLSFVLLACADVGVFSTIALADSAFPALSWLVPAFKNEARLTEDEKIFQKELPRVRVEAEHA